MEEPPVLKRFDEFIADISPKDKIAVFHDSDTDGISSGVIVWRALQRISPKTKLMEIVQEHVQGETTPETLEKIRKSGANKVVMSDLSHDHRPKNLQKLGKKCEVLFIDHHPIYHNLESKTFVYIKPPLFSKNEGAKYPAAKMCYDLFSRAVDLKDSKWVAAVGIIGDFSSEKWKDFIDEASEESGSTWRDLDFLGRLLKSCESVSFKVVPQVFKCMVGAESPKAVLDSKFKKYMEILDKELKKAVSEFDQKAEHFSQSEVHFYLVKGKANIKSVVASIVSSSRPGQTIFVFQKIGGLLAFSVRRQDGKVEVNKLVEKILPKFPKGKGGGHKYASAGVIREQDFEKFKNEVVELLQNWKRGKRK